MPCSKTFTTAETMLNARTARAWLTERLGADAVAKHMIAVRCAGRSFEAYRHTPATPVYPGTLPLPGVLPGGCGNVRETCMLPLVSLALSPTAAPTSRQWPSLGLIPRCASVRRGLCAATGKGAEVAGRRLFSWCSGKVACPPVSLWQCTSQHLTPSWAAAACLSTRRTPLASGTGWAAASPCRRPWAWCRCRCSMASRWVAAPQCVHAALDAAGGACAWITRRPQPFCRAHGRKTSVGQVMHAS